MTAVEEGFERVELDVPELAVEPGRSPIGPAGITLYEVGTVFVFVQVLAMGRTVA